MKWGKRTFGGRRYDLTHLHPSIANVPCAEGRRETLQLRLLFGAHVFSKAWKAGHPEDMKLMDGRTPRCFCPERYEMSQGLAGLVERGLCGHVLISPDKKFVVLGNAPGVAYPYSVFFRMRAFNDPPFDGSVEVVSAYARPRLPKMQSKSAHDLIEMLREKRFAWPKKK